MFEVRTLEFCGLWGAAKSGRQGITCGIGEDRRVNSTVRAETPGLRCALRRGYSARPV